MFQIARRTLAALLVLACAGCAGNQAPDIRVAQTGTTVLAATTELQKGITQLTDAHVLPVPVAQQMTGYVQVVYDKSGALSEALKVYHAATSVAARQSAAGRVQQLLTEISGPLASILGVAVPQGAAAQLTKLVGQVLAVVSSVQQEVARGLTGGLEPAIP